MNVATISSQHERVLATAKRKAEELGYQLDSMRYYVLPFCCEDFTDLYTALTMLQERGNVDELCAEKGTSDVWMVYFEPVSPPGMVTLGGDLEVYVNAETGEVVKYLQGQ